MTGFMSACTIPWSDKRECSAGEQDIPHLGGKGKNILGVTFQLKYDTELMSLFSFIYNTTPLLVSWISL